MKKLLAILALFGVFGIGYVFGSGDTAKIPSETGLSDFGTATSVRTALALNKHLEGAEIDVEVAGGHITLHGTVPSPGHKLLAEEIARGVGGELPLTNQLEIAPGTAPATAATPSRSLGQRLDDLTTTARIKTALALHRDISRGDVSVAVARGEATLTGTVPSWAARELAAKVTEDVEGVSTVRNALQVDGEDGAPSAGANEAADAVTAPRAPANPRDEIIRQRLADGSIEMQVEAALNVNPFVEARRVHVEVNRGHVTLAGAVRTEADRALIEKIVEDCWGVTGVTNELRVEPAPPATLQYAPSPDDARDAPLRNE